MTPQRVVFLVGPPSTWRDELAQALLPFELEVRCSETIGTGLGTIAPWLVLFHGCDGIDRDVAVARECPEVLVCVAANDCTPQSFDRAFALGAHIVIPRHPDPIRTAAYLGSLLRLPNASRPDASTLRYGSLAVEVDAGVARANGRALTLSGSEFSLLLALLRGAGTPVSLERLRKDLCLAPMGPSLQKHVEVRVSRLRKRLPHNSGLTVQNVRGRGYRLLAVGLPP